MTRAWAVGIAILLAGCASAPKVPERDLSQVRVGMSEADVAAIWGPARTMYKLDKTANGCVERHVFGLIVGPPIRPANIDFNVQHRVCAVGAVDVINTEAPRLAADMPPPTPSVVASAAPSSPAPAPPVVASAGPAAPPPATTDDDDVVVLKNGKEIHCKVTDAPQTGPITITLIDGTTRKIARAKVKRVTKRS